MSRALTARQVEAMTEKWRPAAACQLEIDALPSVRRAAFWFRMYREDLYRQTRMHDRLASKLGAAQKIALADADRVMKAHKVESVFLGSMKHGDGLRYAPGWKDIPYEEACRVARAWRRYCWWEKRGDALRAEHWRLVRDALLVVGERSWPLSSAAIARAHQWRATEADREVRRRLQHEAAEEHRRDTEARERVAQQREIERRAEDMLGEIIPGVKSQKRMRKAQGFDALMQLLEGADVDAKTKEAIGRLRGFVEGERGEADRLPSQPPEATAGRNGGRYSEGRDGRMPGPHA